MIDEPAYLDDSEAAALCTDSTCTVHSDGDGQCPILVAEFLTIEAIRSSI